MGLWRGAMINAEHVVIPSDHVFDARPPIKDGLVLAGAALRRRRAVAA